MRLIRILLLSAFCLGLSSACAPKPSPPNPALWKISDADNTIWLFGTVHVLPPGLNWRTARIDAAFAGADTLVLETSIEDGAAPSFAALTQRYGAAPVSRTLNGLTASGSFTPEDQQTLTRVARANALDPARLMPLRPWLAALQLSLASVTLQGQSASAGVEPTLAALARQHGKTLRYLETPEQQIRTLADLSPEDELTFLRATLTQVESEPGMVGKLDAAWASGDVEELAALTERDLKAAGDGVYDALITRRNADWTNQIHAFLDGDKDVFIAVGAAHLVGPNGVIARLRAQGVNVEGP